MSEKKKIVRRWFDEKSGRELLQNEDGQVFDAELYHKASTPDMLNEAHVGEVLNG